MGFQERLRRLLQGDARLHRALERHGRPEDWVAQGIPVGLSLCYYRLRGKGREPSGHLLVCVGFAENGDAVINDPGTSKNVRKAFPRANLIDAWAYSKNAAYFIYPEKAELPVDHFGHWESATTGRA